MNAILMVKNFSSKYKNILLVLLAIIILFVLYMIFDRGSKESTIIGENSLSTTTSELNTDEIILPNTGNYTIEQVPVNEERGGLPSGMPNLDRPVYFSSSVNFEQDVKDLVTSRVKEDQGLLKTDPTNFPAWLDLGVYYKMAGDFQGAIDVWIYATKLSPTNHIAFGNLGNLYAYNLKDMAMADTYYRQAMSKDTSQIYLYVQLAEAYRDVGKNKEKALEVVNQGLTANPNNPALLSLKENLEK